MTIRICAAFLAQLHGSVTEPAISCHHDMVMVIRLPDRNGNVEAPVSRVRVGGSKSRLASAAVSALQVSL